MNIGQKHTKATKKRIAQSLQGRRNGNKNPAWKGGKMHSSGYIYIHAPNHPYKTKFHNSYYVAKHRLVMEKKLKRFLKPTEVVHHINGIRTDNRIKNLVICTSYGKHTAKYHRKSSKPF